MLFDAKAKSVRSIETLRDNTKVIDTFTERYRSDETFEVRRILSRNLQASQYFIITSLKSVQEAKEFSPITSFAEISVRGNHLTFIVHPARQFPNHKWECFLKKIEKSVSHYMKQKYDIHTASDTIYRQKIDSATNLKWDCEKEWHLH